MIPIFITSWGRYHFTLDVVSHIRRRTEYPHSITVFDNGSPALIQNCLANDYREKKIDHLFLSRKNLGVGWPKIVFYSLVPEDCEYFVVADNDILPPLLKPCWLTQMVEIMDRNPDVGFLTPQLPPTWLQGPGEKRGGIHLCKAVGNTFKLVRRKAFPVEALKANPNGWGDDGIVCAAAAERGWLSAFCDNLFCFNLERTQTDYGYTKAELAADPRKQGYDADATKHNYEPVSWNTLEPPKELRQK